MAAQGSFNGSMARSLRWATLVVSLAISAAGPLHAAGWSTEKASRADAIVGRFLQQIDGTSPTGPLPSLVYGVATPEGLIAARGYGDAAPGEPATEHTVYHIGSLAKQFTAATMLDLIARGARLRDGTALSLDLPASQVFSGVAHWANATTNPNAQPVTVRSLLTMTSNLPNFTRSPPARTNPWGRIAASDLLSEIKQLNPSGWPNTFEYSNTSYFLLAEAVEEAVQSGDATPRSYRSVVRQNIFGPAGLRETSFVGEPVANVKMATPIYRRQPVFDQPDWLKGSADITSSVFDLAAWNAALMGERVLPHQSRGLMFSDGARVTPDIYYGMGWFIEHGERTDTYSHSGLVPGFTSYNIIAADVGRPHWVSVTLVLNTDVNEGVDVLARDLLQLVQE